MLKKIYILIFVISSLFANVTNEEILKKLDKIEYNQELIKQEMRLRFEAIDKRFEEMNKRFEARFEAIDKRFEEMNENFNKRFEFISNILTALVAGIFGLIGFMMWDRRSVVAKAKDECIKEVDIKKADRDYVEKLVKAMNELLVKNDEMAKEVFKKYGLL